MPLQHQFALLQGNELRRLGQRIHRAQLAATRIANELVAHQLVGNFDDGQVGLGRGPMAFAILAGLLCLRLDPCSGFGQRPALGAATVQGPRAQLQ